MLLRALAILAVIAAPALLIFAAVPNLLLRLAFGPDQRLLVPLSALGGAAFLMLADLLARLLFPLFDNVIPVGSVTALVGAPLFLVLLYRGGRLTVA